MLRIEIFFASWYYFPIMSLFFVALGAFVLRGGEQAQALIYYWVIADITAFFTLCQIVIPSLYRPSEQSGSFLFFVLSPIVFGLWLLAPYAGACLFALSRFIPRDRDARNLTLAYSISMFVVGVPTVSTYLFGLSIFSHI